MCIHPFPSLTQSISKRNSVKFILEALKYDEYGWEVIGDFKMLVFLIGLQGGFTKFPCYICLWDIRDTAEHYHKRNWSQRTEFSVGKNTVKWEPLMNPQKYCFLL